MKIALDAMGGDYAPRAAVEGAVAAARGLGVGVVLVGDRAKLEKELAEHKYSGLNVTVEHAAEVVTMEDSPLESDPVKPESSLHVSFELLKRGEVEAVVSAGNSGRDDDRGDGDPGKPAGGRPSGDRVASAFERAAALC